MANLASRGTPSEFALLSSDEAQELAKTVGVDMPGKNTIAIGVLVDRCNQLLSRLDELERKTDPAVPEMELEPQQLAAIKERDKP